jgi:transposase, IS30 family
MVRLLHLPQRNGDTLHDALKVRMADLPAALLRSITWDQGTEMALPAALLRSITWDQGTEMARHLTIARSLGAPVYFCDSRSPWQRGSNENTNGLLRDYFPKGHRPEHPLGAAPPSRRERAQQPAQTHPQRPRAGRALRDAASLHNRPRCDID